MTRVMEPVFLSGGPSDGSTYRPTTKWPMYLNADGEKIHASLGDRIVQGRSATKGCYVQQRDMATVRVTSYAWRTVE